MTYLNILEPSQYLEWWVDAQLESTDEDLGLLALILLAKCD